MINACYELLKADGSIVINKKLAFAIGLKEVIIFSELLSRFNYFADKNELDEEGYFYNTISDLERGTTLSRKEQKTAIDNLIKLGLINVKLKGVPAKRYFKIENNFQLIEKYLTLGKSRLEELEEVQKTNDKKSLDKLQTVETSQIVPKGKTRMSLKGKLECPSRTVNNTKYNNTNNNTNIYSRDESQPLIEEKTKESNLIDLKEKKASSNSEIIKEIIDYLNEKANTNYKPTTKATIKYINARLKEKYSLEDFKKVIDTKCSTWLDSNMSMYLRPETLFGNKFESYLNEKQKELPSKKQEVEENKVYKETPATKRSGAYKIL